MYPLTVITCQYGHLFSAISWLYLAISQNLWCGSLTSLARSPSTVQMGDERIPLQAIYHATPTDFSLTIKPDMRALIPWELICYPKCKFEFWAKCRFGQFPCKLYINIALRNAISLPTVRTYCLLKAVNGKVRTVVRQVVSWDCLPSLAFCMPV